MKEVIRARIDGKIKEEAAAVLAEVDLTVSDAFRLMMTRRHGKIRLERRKPTPALRQAQDHPSETCDAN